jgi:putative membrane protein
MKQYVISFTAAALFLLAPALTRAQQISDAEIAAIVIAANQVDIDAGALAASTSASAQVKAFGEQMVAAHTAVNKSASELAARIKLAPKDNATSQSLKAGGEKTVARLRTLKGTAFDKAYVGNEVAYHQQVLDALDHTLIPNAKNPELKKLLEGVRPAFVAHLEHARQLQAALK